MAKVPNLEIDRGTTFPITVTYETSAGAPISLVGATVRFTMKTTEYDTSTTDTTALVKKSVTNGTALGTASIVLNPTDTANIAPGDYFYDVKVDVHSDGTEVYKINEGTVTLDGSPTNRLT